jgi:hypothetical protein
MLERGSPHGVSVDITTISALRALFLGVFMMIKSAKLLDFGKPLKTRLAEL